ncbi:MAG: extracellular solute-binding protein [Anaerolineae bacterium]|jgi:ABC-type glycerol-3-phosphate transport system substrate-binding protein|nr:extracellular solute-binding protein [Anaerolineae bacterium]
MKRILWLLLVLGLLMAACTTPAEPALTPTATFAKATPRPSATALPTMQLITPSPTTIPYLEVDVEDLKGVTVRFWHPFTDDTATQMRQIAETFNSENQYGIRVEVYSIGASGALDERFTEAMQQDGELPTLVAGPLVYLHDWDSQGWLIPVDGYMNFPDWQWAAEDFDEFVLSQHQTAGGEQLSLPLNWYANVLFYNQTWAQELGLNRIPSDLPTFETQACTAKDALLADDDPGNNNTGGYIISRNANTLLSWLAVFGYAEIPVTAAENYDFTTPEAEETFTALWELSNAGCAWQSRIPTPYDYFAERNALFYAGSTRDIFWQERAMENAASADEWIVIPYPSANGQSPLLVDGSGAALVATTPEEQLASWFFLQTLLESRNQALIAIASSSMPVRDSAWEWLSVQAQAHPQWAAVADWSNPRISVPLRADWLIAGNVLEDAAWELYQPFTTVERIPSLLEQLDAMIEEVTGADN